MASLTVFYKINIVIYDINADKNIKFENILTDTITGTNENIYDNYHLLRQQNILSYFSNNIKDYCLENNLPDNYFNTDNVVIDSFEIISNTKNVEIYFEHADNDSEYSLSPIIKAYVEPQALNIERPILKGELLKDNVIRWYFDDDELPHYLTDKDLNIIKQLPIGVTSYIEDNLDYSTSYTRYLIAYNGTKNSKTSNPLTISTNEKNTDSSLRNFSIDKNTDYNLQHFNTVTKRLSKFKNGIGDFNDCKVYKNDTLQSNINTKLIFDLTGYYNEQIKYYPKIAFAYRSVMEYKYRQYTYDGNIDAVLTAYPVINAKCNLLRYSFKELNVNYTISADVYYPTNISKNDGKYNINYTNTKVFYKNTYTINPDKLSYNFEYDHITIQPINELIKIKNFNCIGDLLKSIALKDSNIQQSKNDASNILGISENDYLNNYLKFLNIKIEDNYSYDIDKDSRDVGSFRISNGNLNQHIDYNDNIYAIGSPYLCLYQSLKTFDVDINAYDNSSYNICTPDEYNSTLYNYMNDNALTPTNIMFGFYSENQYLSAVKDSENNITLQINYTNPSTPINVDFSKRKTNLFESYKNLLNNLDNNQKYNFVFEINSCSENIYFNAEKKLSGGNVVENLGYSTDMFLFEARYFLKEYIGKEYFPSKKYDPDYGMVNGSSENKNGKEDYYIRLHEFALNKIYYDIKYYVEFEDIDSENADTVTYKFFNNNLQTSEYNKDLVIFSSDYSKDKVVEKSEIIGKYQKDIEITDEYNHEFKIPTNFTEEQITKYNRYTAECSTDNNLFIVKRTENGAVTEGNVLSATLRYITSPSEKWFIGIHNGYYYLNQNEFYLFSGEPEILNYYDMVNDKSYKTTSAFSNHIKLQLNEMPEQFSPITLKDDNGIFKYLNSDGIYINETFVIKQQKVDKVFLKYSGVNVFEIFINNIKYNDFDVVNNCVKFGNDFNENDIIKIKYTVNNSFITKYDYNLRKIEIIADRNLINPVINYESNNNTNRYIPEYVSLNPVYNTNFDGFIYIDNKKYNVDKIKINCTTTTAFYNVNDRITFYVQLLDINNNPVPNKEISVYIDNNDSNDFGTIEYYKNNISDNNGIVPVTYYPNGDFINDSIVTINIKCNSIEEHLSIKVKKRVI